MPATMESSSAALSLARADVDRGQAALTAAVADVAAQVTSLVGDGWRGAAATAFGAGFEEWRRGAARVLEALSDTAVRARCDKPGLHRERRRRHRRVRRARRRLGGAT